MWLCAPSTIFWGGYITCNCYGELHVISGISWGPGTTLLLLLRNILGPMIAHSPPPAHPPPVIQARKPPLFTNTKPILTLKIPLLTLFEHFWICQWLLLVICANCFASIAFVKMGISCRALIRPWTDSLASGVRAKKTQGAEQTEWGLGMKILHGKHSTLCVFFCWPYSVQPHQGLFLHVPLSLVCFSLVHFQLF